MAADGGPSRLSTALPFLRGVNFGGLTHETWSQAPAPAAYDYYLRQKKMNVVRLVFTWEWIQPRMQAPLDPERCRVIDEQIGRAATTGAYVILEFHNFGRRTVDGVEQIIGESAACSATDFADAWGRMAQRWGRNDRVILGLMNEPHDQSTEVLLAVSNAAIAAIRRAGATGLVMVSGNDWNSMGWSKGSDNQKWMLHIKDEANNFCFDVHHYFDDWSAGQTPNVREDSLASMLSFTAWAKAHRMRAFCGEFGCGVNKRGLDACRDLLAHIEANKDVFIGWAWWGAGGPWQPDYVFLLDPYASVTSPTNPDPAGALTWAEPVDRPQMKLLQEFLPADATPFNAWLIEVQLASKIGVLYRKGDYRGASKTCLFGGAGCASEWLDSGPRRISARSKSSRAPASQRDGSVRFARAQSLAMTLPPTDRITDVYATVKLAAPFAAARRHIVAGMPSGSQRSEGLAIESKALRPSVEENVRLLQAARRPPEINKPKSADAGTASIASLTWIEGRLNAAQTTIGAADPHGTEDLNGSVFDLLMLRKGVTPDEQARLQGRLFWDLGLAHTLPPTHPYRSRAPSWPAQ